MRARGVAPDDRVAIAIPDGIEMVLAFLSVSAVATAAPINLALGQSEYESYFAELGVTRLLTSADDDAAVVLAAHVRGIPILRVSVDDSESSGIFATTGSDSLAPDEELTVRGDQIALALTTSGTTSRPKVVTLTHADIYLAAVDTAASVNLESSDRLLNVMPLYHSHGLVGGMVTSLSAGASVICSPGFDAVRFFHWVDDFQPTWYTAAPTLHHAVLSRADSHRREIARSRLRLIRSTSAPLPDAVHRGLEEHFRVPVIQAYALTESAGVVTSNPLPPGVRKVGSVGVPAGIEIAIRNESNDSLAADEIGEIAIRGDRVIRGYDKPEAVGDSSFVDGWFRTGDNGYVDRDGYLYVTGRLKESINRAGEKVNPNEVDAVLSEHPAVSQVCTFGTPHPTLGQDVATAVVLRAGRASTETEMREFVADQLAFFKVPTRVIFVGSLPSSHSGKVPRNALAERFKTELAAAAAQPVAASSTAPTALAARVAEVYAEVLGVSGVGADDNFFDLGGDSMLGTQVLTRINAILGYRVPPLVLFDNPTVAQFSHALERLNGGTDASLPPMAEVAKDAARVRRADVKRRR